MNDRLLTMNHEGFTELNLFFVFLVAGSSIAEERHQIKYINLVGLTGHIPQAA